MLNAFQWPSPPTLAATARTTVMRDGTTSLYRFGRPPEAADGPTGAADDPTGPALRPPVLIVPSMINRWYVVDMRPGFSLVEALVDAGHDVWCLDWGVPNDEDRYLRWDDVVARLDRAVRWVRRRTRHERLVLIGYCMGGTLTAIEAALRPEWMAGLINLLGPVNFAEGGPLAMAVDARWFDPVAMTASGNLPAAQMQSGFSALRPTLDLAKYVRLADTWTRPGTIDAFVALDTWASDNVPFPGQAYVTWIRDLYQNNDLYEGRHRVALGGVGTTVDLGRIDCPLLTVTATRDTICPPKAALGLEERAGSQRRDRLQIEGGHVGAVVGSRGPKVLYPGLNAWLETLGAG